MNGKIYTSSPGPRSSWNDAYLFDRGPAIRQNTATIQPTVRKSSIRTRTFPDRNLHLPRLSTAVIACQLATWMQGPILQRHNLAVAACCAYAGPNTFLTLRKPSVEGEKSTGNVHMDRCRSYTNTTAWPARSSDHRTSNAVTQGQQHNFIR